MNEGAQPSIDRLPHAHKTDAEERAGSSLVNVRVLGVVQSQFLPPFLHQIIIISYFLLDNCISEIMAVASGVFWFNKSIFCSQSNLVS